MKWGSSKIFGNKMDVHLCKSFWKGEYPFQMSLFVCFVCFYGRPPEGRKVGVPIRDSASRPGLALVTPPSRHWTWEQDKHSYLLGQFKSLHHNNSCNWIPLIARNLAGWTFVCPRRNLVHPAPENKFSGIVRTLWRLFPTSDWFPILGPSSKSVLPVAWITEPTTDPRQGS